MTARRPLLPLLLPVMLLLAVPAAAQNLLSDTKSESSTADVLQKLLLGKAKESATKAEKASGGTAAGGGTAERLPRKAPGTGAKAEPQPDSPPAKSRAGKPRATSQADFHPMPRLKPSAPISGSPTIQPIRPIPMPPDSGG